MEGDMKPLVVSTFSAPAKVFLTGEHAVLSGKTAITFSLDKRTTCEISVYDREKTGWPFLDIECKFFKLIFDSYQDLKDVEHLDATQRGAIKTFITAVDLVTAECEGFDINTFKYGFSIKLKYNFPYGVGLGSSASFNVALGGGVYTTILKIAKKSYRNMTDLSFDNPEDLWKFKLIADEGEKVIHSSVSGINTTTVALGGVIRFKNTFETYNEVLESSKGVNLPADFKFDIVNTGITRSTHDQLDDMIVIKNVYPDIYDSVIETISKTTEKIEDLLTSEESNMSKFAFLLDTNHHLLESLNLGLEIIDEIYFIGVKNKVICKIAGAGCGGCLLAVYTEFSNVEGFRAEINTLHGKGVSILQTTFSNAGFQCDSWEHS